MGQESKVAGQTSNVDHHYDDANGLTAFNGPSLTATFGYNGLGDRLGQTVNGQTTQYTLDLNAGLTQVLADGTDTDYYGVDRVAQKQGGEYGYFLGDALGGVRQMTDPNGTSTLAQPYDPYGNLITSTGSGSTIHGYAGEVVDDSTNLIYLRSRMYDPAAGRFLTKDPWQGDDNRPLSHNRWSYVEGNPVNYTDPSGTLFDLSQLHSPPTPIPYSFPAFVTKMTIVAVPLCLHIC